MTDENEAVRTTLSLDAEVLAAARRIAEARSQSIGQVISELARRGLEGRARVTTRKGFPVFRVPKGAAPISLDDVKRDEDEE